MQFRIIIKIGKREHVVIWETDRLDKFVRAEGEMISSINLLYLLKQSDSHFDDYCTGKLSL